MCHIRHLHIHSRLDHHTQQTLILLEDFLLDRTPLSIPYYHAKDFHLSLMMDIVNYNPRKQSDYQYIDYTLAASK